MRSAHCGDSWSRGRLIHLGACPACGSSKISGVYRRQDDTASMPDIWRMVRCGQCGSMYLADRPDAESLPLAYAAYYTHGHQSDKYASAAAASLTVRLVNGYLNARFRMARSGALSLGALLFPVLFPLRMKLDVYGRHVPTSLCNSQASLLDVGCGNGAFLLRAKEMGIEAHGCEPDASAAAGCKDMGLDVVAGDIESASYEPSSFDYITLNHVIEHVENAPELLARLLSLLKPGRTLWMALPNPGALGVSIFGRAWKGFHPPFHLLIPSHAILARWLASAGFVGVRFVRRGIQSPGLWGESMSIARREGVAPASMWSLFAQRVGDVLSSTGVRWSEETVVVAQRAAQ